MFLQMLSREEQSQFLKTAWLVSICDNPLLWGGKTEDEITGETDLSDVSFQHDKSETAIMKGFMSECEQNDFEDDCADKIEIEYALIKGLKSLPITKQNDPAQRQQLAEKVLSKLFPKKIKSSSPASSKIMLYELLLLALADGEVSGTESALIKQFTGLHQIDDSTYADVLDRAETMNREAVKTLSLILE